MRSKDLRAGIVLFLPLLTYFLFLFVYPLLTLFQSAFTNVAGSLTLNNFSKMITDPVLVVSLKNTLYYFLGSVALQYSVGFGVALLLYGYAGKLKTLFRTIIYLPLMVSPVLIALMWLMILNPSFGPMDYFLRLLGLPAYNWLGSTSLAMPSVILANGWEYAPFVFMILYGGLLMVPQHLYDAASVDGMSRFQAFRYITLPSIRPYVIIAFILNSIGILQGFAMVYVLTSGGPGYATYILSYYIYQVGFSFFDKHYAAALSLLFLLIMVIFVVVMLTFTGAEKYLGLKRTEEG